MYGFANLRLSIVTKQGILCTILMDVIFKSARNVTFTPHRIDGSEKTLTSTEELHHFSTAMTKKTYIKAGIRKSVTVATTSFKRLTFVAGNRLL
jgi:hypothetical protein